MRGKCGLNRVIVEVHDLSGEVVIKECSRLLFNFVSCWQSTYIFDFDG